MPITTPAQLDLATRVREQITTYPEQHAQHTWWRKTECGTTACIAGWTATLDGAALRQEARSDAIYAWSVTVPKTGCLVEIGEYAMHALGLDAIEAGILFYGAQSNAEALEYLSELIAAGNAAMSAGAR